MEKLKISQLADQYRSQHEHETNKQKEAELKEAESEAKTLLSIFEKAFESALPLLKEAGISYSVHRNNAKYKHYGHHVKFEMENKVLRMDFSSNGSYRYENVLGAKVYPTMQYGTWPLEQFYVWIDENLIQKPNPIQNHDDDTF